MNLPGRYDLLHRRSRIRFQKRRPPPGAAPDTLVADPNATATEIELIMYGPDTVVEKRIEDPDELEGLVGTRPVVWVNVNGLADHDVLLRLADRFGAHRLVLEDAVNVGQRAKVELYGRQLFVVVRMPLPRVAATEQVSLLLGDGFLLTIQERAGDEFDLVRERVRNGTGRIRHCGPDYLAYALIDAAMEGYSPVLEHLGDELDALEDEVFGTPGKDTLARLHGLKREFVNLRKAIQPHREVLSAMTREGGDLIVPDTLDHLRDTQDFVARIVDLNEALREVAGDLMNTYLTIVSNRMNEVMKVLTIVATVFIPLSFIAGVYGMNFDPGASRWNMPELGWAFGYPAVLALMVLVGGGMLYYVWSRRWL